MTHRVTRTSVHTLIDSASEPPAPARVTRQMVQALVDASTEPPAPARVTRHFIQILSLAPTQLGQVSITTGCAFNAILQSEGAPAEDVYVTQLQAQALVFAPESDIGVRASMLNAEVLDMTSDTSVRVSQLGAEVLLVPDFSQLCPTFPVVFRLRIAGDGGDILTVTSYSDGGALIAEAPRVDGQTFDPLTGKVTVGQANVLVIDATEDPCGENDTYSYRYVTSILADENGYSQLLGRAAYLEIARDLSTLAYEPWFAGYITGIRLVDGITYEISLAHTTRDDETTKVWATSESTSLYARSCWLGGPVTAPVPSPEFVQSNFEGYWQATVKGVYDTFVHLDINEDDCAAFPPNDIKPYLEDNNYFRNLTGWGSNDREQKRIFEWHRNRAQKYYVTGAPTSAAATEWASNPTGKPNIYGYFPRLIVQVISKNNSALNYRAPVMASYSGQLYAGGTGNIVQVWEDLGNHFYLYWPDADLDVDDVLTFYALPLDVSEAAPVWVYGHPAEILRDALLEAGVSVNGASVTETIAGVGPFNLALRISEPPTIAKMIEMLCGAFGMGVRYEQDGTRSLFCWRTRATPVATITLDDIVTQSSSWWKTEEQSRLFSIEWKLRRYLGWPGAESNATPGDRAFDGISEVEEAPITFTVGQTQPAGSRTQSYDVPGMLFTRDGLPGFDDREIRDMVNVCAGWSDQAFATFANGSIITELEVFHELLDGVVPGVGQEVWLDLPVRPGFSALESPTSQRGLVDRAIVLASTPTQTGYRLTLMAVTETGPPPVGNGIQFDPFPALDASFTSAKGTPPNQYVDLTLVDDTGYENYGYLKVQYAVQDTMPTSAGTDWGFEWFPPGTLTIGPFPQGSKVWTRARSFAGLAIGNWTAWQSVTLDAGTSQPPTGVVQTPAIGYDVDAATGDIDVTVQTGPEAVKVYAATSTSTFPNSAAILAGSTDTVAPYVFNNLANIDEGETAYIGVIAEDSLGNRSLPGYAVAVRSFLDSIAVTFVGGVSASDYRDFQIPYKCEVIGWSVIGQPTGSIVVDVWRDTIANFPPTVADSIAGTGKPTISSGVSAQAGTTGWSSTSLLKDDILRFNVDSVTSFTQVTVSLTVRRT